MCTTIGSDFHTGDEVEIGTTNKASPTTCEILEKERKKRKTEINMLVGENLWASWQVTWVKDDSAIHMLAIKPQKLVRKYYGK